jgi:hypothetical protein
MICTGSKNIKTEEQGLYLQHTLFSYFIIDILKVNYLGPSTGPWLLYRNKFCLPCNSLLISDVVYIMCLRFHCYLLANAFKLYRVIIAVVECLSCFTWCCCCSWLIFLKYLCLGMECKLGFFFYIWMWSLINIEENQKNIY